MPWSRLRSNHDDFDSHYWYNLLVKSVYLRHMRELGISIGYKSKGRRALHIDMLALLVRFDNARMHCSPETFECCYDTISLLHVTSESFLHRR